MKAKTTHVIGVIISQALLQLQTEINQQALTTDSM